MEEQDIMVSINCITYNHEKYIEKAIESFLMQKTNFKYEILIYDDASTDNTPNIIKRYEEKYPELVKPIYQNENKYSKGIKVNYEYNIKRSKGKYIAMCEGDDYWIDEYKLQKQVDYMQTNEDCTLCVHSADKIDDRDKSHIEFMRPYMYNTKIPIEDLIIGGGQFVATASILFRKDCFLNPPQLYFDAPVGDYPLQIITAYEGYAYYIDEVMSVYRSFVDNSWTSRTFGHDVHDRDKKIIKHRINVNKMLDRFDIYSNGKYKEAIYKRKLINEFDIHVIKKDVEALKCEKFKNLYENLIKKVRKNYKF